MTHLRASSLTAVLLLAGCGSRIDLTAYPQTFDLAGRLDDAFVRAAEPNGERPSAVDGDLHLPSGSEVSFFVEVAGESLLFLEGLDASGHGRLDVGIRFAGTDAEAVEPLEPSTGQLSVGLAGAGSPARLVRVRLAAAGEPGGVLVLQAPRLVSASEITTELRGVPGASASQDGPAPTGLVRPPRPPNVVIYLVDTLRADHLGCYGYPKPTSPRLDAFAAEGIVFEHATSQASWTRASAASILTGLNPPSHGVLHRDDALSDQAQTLAELLHAAGYRTGGFVANGNAGPDFGFGQGFDVFRLFLEEHTSRLHASAQEVDRTALAWLDQTKDDRPFFLWLHTMEPHAPYAPVGVEPPALAPPTRDAIAAQRLETMRKNHEARFGTAAARLVPGTLIWLTGLHLGLLEPTPESTAALVDLYDDEIHDNDAAFGMLLDGLAKRGLSDDTLVVFTSDHGEEMHDHGDWEHGRTLYQEQLHVPLVLRLPGGGRGLRSAVAARHVDLLPTIADLAGIDRPPGLEGRSLLDAAWDTPAYAQLDLDDSFGESLIEGRFKLICDDPAHTRCRLFDLQQDPGEHDDLAAVRPVLAGYLERRLAAYRKREGALAAREAEIPEGLRKNLQALGYLE